MGAVAGDTFTLTWTTDGRGGRRYLRVDMNHGWARMGTDGGWHFPSRSVVAVPIWRLWRWAAF